MTTTEGEAPDPGELDVVWPHKTWHRLYTTQGVHRVIDVRDEPEQLPESDGETLDVILRDGDETAPDPNDLIVNLIEYSAEGESTSVSPDVRVSVTGGPYQLVSQKGKGPNPPFRLIAPGAQYGVETVEYGQLLRMGPAWNYFQERGSAGGLFIFDATDGAPTECVFVQGMSKLYFHLNDDGTLVTVDSVDHKVEPWIVSPNALLLPGIPYETIETGLAGKQLYGLRFRPVEHTSS